MGSNISQSYNETREFNNTVLQASSQSCSITCATNFNNDTVIIIGGTGGVNIKQSCKITDASCQLKAAFEAGIENIIESTVSQSASAIGGISFTFSNQNQDINLSSTVNNSISQIMSSSCKISSEANQNNNYFLFVGRDGDINLGQDASISGANCSMDNYAKASTFNKAVSDASQKAKVQNVFAMMFMGIIVMMVLVGIALIAFVLTGGVNKAIDGATQTANNPDAIKALAEAGAFA